MAKHTVKAFIHYEQDFKGQPLFTIFPFDMSSCGKVMVETQDIEITIPDDFNPITAQVDLLKAEREKVRAELGKRLMQIDDAIAKLTCIDYTPTGPVVVGDEFEIPF